MVLVAVGVITALVVLIGAVVLATGGDEDAATDTTAVEVAHVHGLGVDPQDDTLYAGTHYGLIRLPEQGEPTRVADRMQDFMGFTVVGPGHYLASGHPGEGQDDPGSLGLIETTDGGQTWESLSLAGEADFHALEARHGRVYGLNALTGEFMVSEDKQTWDTRAALPMADFAVSPDDPDVLLATTEQGLARSEDGGNTYTAVPAAPLLQLVSWTEDGTIIGAAPDGTVHASTDGGQTWQQRGTLSAAPHALTATSGSDVFAAVDGAILASSDGGRSFDVRYRD
jgi:photosystem II stability/assembly factor-like uncharacterized protein